MAEFPVSTLLHPSQRVNPPGLDAKLNAMIQAFWENQQRHMAATSQEDLKSHNVPVARVKKVMRSDDTVKSLMISGETPILLAKAAEIFIEELTLRAWLHTEEDRRRTLHRPDVAQAVAQNEMFDFLIDIVPRDAEWVRGNSMSAEAHGGAPSQLSPNEHFFGAPQVSNPAGSLAGASLDTPPPPAAHLQPQLGHSIEHDLMSQLAMQAADHIKSGQDEHRRGSA
ncbi:Nuclear transcription factor Y subunit C-2 [Gonapodya sp. JEL0774]|nr:Nuclear transcription factor Y subunit C-2 [Gonapodya sp. JEL0774]